MVLHLRLIMEGKSLVESCIKRKDAGKIGAPQVQHLTKVTQIPPLYDTGLKESQNGSQKNEKVIKEYVMCHLVFFPPPSL